MAQLDFSAKIRAYPYLSPSGSVLSTARTGPAGTSPEASNFLDQLIVQLEAGVLSLSGITVPTNEPTTGEDEWKRASMADFAAIKQLADNLGKAVEGLNKIVEVLSKILQIIELFVSGFSSFSKILSSFIDYGKQTINNFVKDLKGGVYLNILAPPAFLQAFSDNPNFAEMSAGGFQGFISRLQTSINNPLDPNRPNFSSDAVVGGMVIVVDSESTDEIWAGLQQLAALFDFVKLFGLNLTPPPPKGLKGRCGFFKKSTSDPEPAKLAIKLEWQSSSITSQYLVYRSTVPGGTQQVVDYVPTSLMDDPETNQPGLFTVAKDILFGLFTGKPFALPKKLVNVYDESLLKPKPAIVFNTNGKPIKVKSSVAGTTISFTDTFVDEHVQQYYYVIKSGESGANSVELAVEVKKCNNAISMASVIPHPGGHYEFMSAGFGAVNSWSSFEIGLAVPWVLELAKILNNFLDSMKGMVNDATDSFMNFINQIKEKIQLYIGILNTVSYLIGVLKSFILGPSIAFLELPPAKGGTDNFVERIKTAKLPPAEPDTNGIATPGFSGPNGITIGVVIMYAGGEVIATAISFIMSLFIKK